MQPENRINACVQPENYPSRIISCTQPFGGSVSGEGDQTDVTPDHWDGDVRPDESFGRRTGGCGNYSPQQVFRSEQSRVISPDREKKDNHREIFPIGPANLSENPMAGKF